MGGKGLPARKAVNLTVNSELISRKIGSLHVSQPFGSSWPVTGVALPLPFLLDTVHDITLLSTI